MEQRSMTALVSAFSRAYHYENNTVRVFADSVAGMLLSPEEYRQIADSMARGITFFNPGFTGDESEALRWVVDNQLSPTPLGRAAFAEGALEAAVQSGGVRQYLILAAGYDTFAYRQPAWGTSLEIFEIDHPATGEDKRRRLQEAGIQCPGNLHFVAADFNDQGWQDGLAASGHFNSARTSFCSLLGIVYYLPKQAFEQMLATIAGLLPEGSSIAFDYPDENTYTEKAGARAKKQVMLAGGANEKMLAGYGYAEMEQLLQDNGFAVREHLTPDMIAERYFKKYNLASPEHAITAFDNVNYCLAVRS